MSSTHAEDSKPRLRLHIEESGTPGRPHLEEFGHLPTLCRSFERATGWPLRYGSREQDASRFVWARQVGDPDGGGAPLLALDTPIPDVAAGDLECSSYAEFTDVRDLAVTLSEILQELDRTRCALWEREAELAAGVPVAHQPGQSSHLAARLEAVLKAGAEAADCQAAAIYMLDEATRQLKLRSCWGLPRSRFLDAPRPLRGAAADLEALVGHAVVLEDTRYLAHWRIPEEFAAAACVPISSPTTLLGTLWVFSDQPRGFSDDQTNVLEIVAGRIASDLEREVLLNHSLQSGKIVRQLMHASQWQQSRLPRIKPLLDGWEMAGWTAQADALGGDFHDWFVLPDSSLAIAVGDAQGRMFEAALTGATLHTALKSHAGYRHTVGEMLCRINETLWTASTGGQFASLFYAMIQPDSGRFQFSAAGSVEAAVVGDSVRRLLADERHSLGVQPDAEYGDSGDELAVGDVLVACTEGIKRTLTPASRRQWWRMIQRNRDRSTEELVDKIGAYLEKHAEPSNADDQTVLVVKRTAP